VQGFKGYDMISMTARSSKPQLVQF